MDIKELRTQSVSRLGELQNEQVMKIKDLRFSVGTRQQTHVRDLRKAKRLLARINTVLQEQQKAMKAA